MLLLFACSETVEYTLVKLETGRTVIPPSQWLFTGLSQQRSFARFDSFSFLVKNVFPPLGFEPMQTPLKVP